MIKSGWLVQVILLIHMPLIFKKISEAGIAGMFDTTQGRAADMAERYGANTYKAGAKYG